MKPQMNQEKGAILPIFAVAVLVLVLLVAASINIGWMSNVKSQAQAAVDAAALSGAAGIPNYIALNGDKDIVDRLALSYNGDPADDDTNSVAKLDPSIETARVHMMEYNGGPPQPAVDVPSTNAVRVVKDYSVPLFFGGVVNMLQWTVRVQATATLGAPGCAEVDFPVALVADGSQDFCSDNQCDQVSSVAIQTNSNIDNSAFFNYLGNPISARSCKDMVDGSGRRTICTGEEIELGNGQMTACLKKMNEHCNDIDCENVPWVVTVPVVTSASIAAINNGNNFVQQAPIAGFAKIWIGDIVDTRSQKSISYTRLCNQTLPDAVSGGMRCGIMAQVPVLVE